MRWRRIVALIIVLVVIVPILAVAVMVARFNPDQYKPQLIAAIENATHRHVTITGSLRLSGVLTPTVSVDGITLANPQGFPDPDMLSLKRIEARVALLPLLSGDVDIIRLVLDDPKIRLEKNAAGQGNWIFAPPPAASSSTTSAPQGHGKAPKIALQSVTIRNATITYVEAAHPITVTIAQLTGTASSLTAPLHLDMTASVNGAPVTVIGTTGPIARLTGVLSEGAWPVDVQVTAGSASLHLLGSIQKPRSASGIDIAVDGGAKNLATLDSYLPGMSVPPVQNIRLRAHVALAYPGALPAITDLHVSSDGSDLGNWRAGLSLSSLDLDMASLDQPLTMSLAGRYVEQNITLNGTIGPLGPALRGMLGIPVPHGAPPPDAGHGQSRMVDIDLQAGLGDATFGVTGGMATPQNLAGIAIKLTAQLPDLTHLAPLLGIELPNLTNLAISGLLTDPGGQGLRHAIGVNSLAISADQLQLGGSANLAFGSRPDLQAIVNVPRIDLSALLSSMPKSSGSPGQAQDQAQPQGQRRPQPQGSPASAAESPGLIPTTPIPFALLRNADADVELTIGNLRYQGATYRAIVAHAVLSDGRLNIRPLDGQLPGGTVQTSITMNAGATPPSMAAEIKAPAFRVKDLLALLGLPSKSGNGTAALYAQLSGAGNSPHAIASRLNGAIGLSMVNGSVDGAVLRDLFGRALTTVGLSSSLASVPGPVQVRCLAMRLDAKDGIGTLSALTLDSSRLLLRGSGTIAFGPETLNLVLQPHLSAGSQSVPIAVAMTGTFRKPVFGPAPPSAYAASLSSLASQAASPNGTSVLGHLAQAFGVGPKSGAAQGDTCSGSLALARMGHPGPTPAASSASPTPSGSTTPPAQGGPQDLLRSLLK